MYTWETVLSKYSVWKGRDNWIVETAANDHWTQLKVDFMLLTLHNGWSAETLKLFFPSTGPLSGQEGSTLLDMDVMNIMSLRDNSTRTHPNHRTSLMSAALLAKNKQQFAKLTLLNAFHIAFFRRSRSPFRPKKNSLGDAIVFQFTYNNRDVHMNKNHLHKQNNFTEVAAKFVSCCVRPLLCTRPPSPRVSIIQFHGI